MKIQIARTSTLIILLMLLPGCQSVPDKPATDHDLKTAIAGRGSISFRSCGGKWVRMDCNSDLTFLPGGKAHMFEYGLAVTSYDGSYTINRQGELIVTFPTFGVYPAMELRQDSKSLLLRPMDNHVGFVFGNRGGATISGDYGDYWPFRPVTIEEEKKIRDASTHGDKSGALAAATADDLNQAISQHGSIVFRSRDGQWLGADNDEDVIFLPKAHVQIKLYLDTIIIEEGTYTVDASGMVSLSVVKPRPFDSTMRLYRDDAGLFLMPEHPGLQSPLATFKEGTLPFRAIPATNPSSEK